eukprot:gene17317-23626_t
MPIKKKRNRNRNRNNEEEEGGGGGGDDPDRILDRNHKNRATPAPDNQDTDKKYPSYERSHSKSTLNYVNLASVQWIRFECVKEDAYVYNFIGKHGVGKFMAWDMDEHVHTIVGKITSNSREDFFQSGPFKVFIPIRIQNGEVRGEFFIQRTFEDPPTILSIYNAVRTTFITAISFVLVSQGDDNEVRGNKQSAEQYLSQVIVQNFLMRITGGARHVYVHWQKKRLNVDVSTRRTIIMKRLPMSPIPIK